MENRGRAGTRAAPDEHVGFLFESASLIAFSTFLSCLHLVGHIPLRCVLGLAPRDLPRVAHINSRISLTESLFVRTGKCQQPKIVYTLTPCPSFPLRRSLSSASHPPLLPHTFTSRSPTLQRQPLHELCLSGDSDYFMPVIGVPYLHKSGLLITLFLPYFGLFLFHTFFFSLHTKLD